MSRVSAKLGGSLLSEKEKNGEYMDWLEIAKVVGAVIAAVVGGGLVLKKISKRNSRSDIRIVSQKNNTAGGDIVAGDSSKKNLK